MRPGPVRQREAGSSTRPALAQPLGADVGRLLRPLCEPLCRPQARLQFFVVLVATTAKMSPWRSGLVHPFWWWHRGRPSLGGYGAGSVQRTGSGEQQRSADQVATACIGGNHGCGTDSTGSTKAVGLCGPAAPLRAMYPSLEDIAIRQCSGIISSAPLSDRSGHLWYLQGCRGSAAPGGGAGLTGTSNLIADPNSPRSTSSTAPSTASTMHPSDITSCASLSPSSRRLDAIGHLCARCS